jgi:uncharacterized protein YraI
MSSARVVAWCFCACLALPAIAAAQTAYLTTAVNVRAGPDSAYPVVVRVAPGAPLTVFGCLGDWSWCDVGAGPNRGWVYAKFLVYPYQSRRVPIIAYGPSLGLPIIAFSVGPYWDSYYRGRPWYVNRTYWEHRPPPPVRPSPRPPTIQPVRPPPTIQPVPSPPAIQPVPSPPTGGRPPNGGRPPGGGRPPPDQGGGPPPGTGPRPAVQ